MRLMKNLCAAAFMLVLPLAALGGDDEASESSGDLTTGVQQFDSDTGSSKLNEYRDIRDGFYLSGLSFDFVKPKTGFFTDLTATSLGRKDQRLRFRLGDYGSWRFILDRNEIPHDLSNKAKTPFIDQGDGLFTLPTTVPIPNPDLTPDAAQLLANDEATAAWLATHLHDTDLGTQRNKTSGTLLLTPSEHFELRLIASDERREGSKISYGPIGDRPPRTLNVQLGEPVDYGTREVRLEAEYNRSRYQVLWSYLISAFGNEIDALTWQNMYADASGGATYEQWADHRVATFGRKPLPPENLYHNASLTFGVDMPWSSRLTTTAALGWLRQDESLLPYSTSDFGNSLRDFSSTADLPRRDADAAMDTVLVNVDYTINPVVRLNLRPFVRFYSLDNDTPQERWWYVTDDTIPGTSEEDDKKPTYKNQRTNMPYAYDTTSFGLDASYVIARTTLGLRAERQEVDRDFREADTAEDILKGTVRVRPTDWMTLRGSFSLGEREGDGYDYRVTSASYWYDPIGRDTDNPAVSFGNHPDMRKFDVSDRRRNQLDLSASFAPRESFDLAVTYLLRDDDFDSDVRPTQPLRGNPYAVTPEDALAFTPGDQLGLLSSKTQRYALDAAYLPTERLTLTAFGGREDINLRQRGLEFSEDHKLDPVSSGIDGEKEVGSWARASSQWLAATDDVTDTVGLGLRYAIVEDTLSLLADVTISRGELGIEYSGFGTQSGRNPATTLPDTHEAAFRTPPAVEHDQDVFSTGLEYQRGEHLTFGLNYLLDRYEIEDWMQEANAPWFQSVGGDDHLIRDSSAPTSTQWGNRLPNLGSYLAPSYEAQVVYAYMRFRF